MRRKQTETCTQWELQKESFWILQGIQWLKTGRKQTNKKLVEAKRQAWSRPYFSISGGHLWHHGSTNYSCCLSHSDCRTTFLQPQQTNQHLIHMQCVNYCQKPTVFQNKAFPCVVCAFRTLVPREAPQRRVYGQIAPGTLPCTIKKKLSLKLPFTCDHRNTTFSL